MSILDRGVEIDYDLSGLEAEWTAEGESRASWRGWLPHATVSVARAWTRGSVEHDSLASAWKSAGLLAMRGQVFPPSPGATLVCDSASPFEISCGGVDRKSEQGSDGRHSAEATLPASLDPVPIRIALRTGGGEPDFEIAVRKAGTSQVRPLKPAARAPRPAAPDADRIVLVDAEGKERPLARDRVRQFRSSAISLMPDGFKKLGDGKLRDLAAFLCTEPKK